MSSGTSRTSNTTGLMKPSRKPSKSEPCTTNTIPVEAGLELGEQLARNRRYALWACPDLFRDDAGLREIVANWHRLTPEVR
jgi:hypothetical protein